DPRPAAGERVGVEPFHRFPGAGDLHQLPAAEDRGGSDPHPAGCRVRAAPAVMRSLNTRLVAGLLTVTTVGLLLLATISKVVLRGYLIHRVDQQLAAVRERPVLARVDQSVDPGRYIVLSVGRDGAVRAVGLDGPDPSEAIAQARRLGSAALFAEAARGR